MAKHTRVDARNARGSELAIQEQITDTPVLPPAEQLEKYENINAGTTAWLLAQTEKEADFRRNQVNKVNIFTFINILVGQIFGLFIGLFGISMSAYLAMHDAEVTGSVIGGATVVGLVSAFLIGSKKK